MTLASSCSGSLTPSEDTTITQLGHDVLALMDALHEDKAILSFLDE